MVNEKFWAGKRVFLTGHTGFKGAWLALWLAKLGARVHALALPPATSPSLWALVEGRSGVNSTMGDIRDLDALKQAMAAAHPDVVFHLAAQALVRASYDDPVGTYATNVMGTVHVLEAARQLGVRAIVNVTSDKCYDNVGLERGYREDDPMGGRDPYSSSKGCAELVTSAYRSSFFKPLASARAGNVIGGGDWAADRIVPDIVRAALAGKPVQVRNPHAVRPWQHVLEPLAGYLLLAERVWERPEQHAEGWNFGPDERDAVPVQKLVETLIRLWGPPAEWHADRGEHPHEAHFLRLDSSKARSRLGWKPRLSLDKALEWTVDWYRRQARGEDARALTLGQIERYTAMA
ncbi:MAG TPA: CDP-glucose 4,6-dehydratase [Burkholderiales bacterium]|nr:CDP-glucose 4,6-dehydratase [Burkholderiales bacterium]